METIKIFYLLSAVLVGLSIMIVGYMSYKRNTLRFKETSEFRQHVWLGVFFVFYTLSVHLTDYKSYEKYGSKVLENKYMIWQYVLSIIFLFIFLYHFKTRLKK